MYIREYTDSGSIANGQSLPVEPGSDQASVTFTTTAGTSAAFKNNTRMVTVAVDGIACIVFGLNPTAVVNTGLRMSAGQSSTFLVPMGQSYKVSAVTASA
jgi:hypothetical protein